MPEQEVKSEVKKDEKKKKGILGKIRDKVIPDHEESAAILSSMVRLGVLVWSGGRRTSYRNTRSCTSC